MYDVCQAYDLCFWRKENAGWAILYNSCLFHILYNKQITAAYFIYNKPSLKPLQNQCFLKIQNISNIFAGAIKKTPLYFIWHFVYRTFHKYITSYSICMSEMKGRGSLKQVSTWDDELMTIITRVYRLVSRTVKCNAYCNRQKYTSVKLFNVVKIKILKIWYQEHSNNISTLYTALLVLSTEWKSRFISFQTFLYKTEILFILGKHTLFFFSFRRNGLWTPVWRLCHTVKI